MDKQFTTILIIFLKMTRILHVSNISPSATKEQIQTLFAYVGRIEEFKVYFSFMHVFRKNKINTFSFTPLTS
jgi:hypothetical protein